MECILCRRHNDKFEMLENIQVGYEDGSVEAVYDILHQIAGVDIFIPQASKCCTDCVFEIHNYSTKQRALAKIKGEIIAKLSPYFNEVKKSTVTADGKRKRVKPVRLIKEETDDEDSVANCSESLIPVNPIGHISHHRFSPLIIYSIVSF